MTLYTLEDLETHLKSLTSIEQGRIYGVIAPDLVERQVVVSRVVTALCGMYPDLQKVALDLGEISPQRLKSELTTLDLLSWQKIIHLKCWEEASKQIVQTLEEVVSAHVLIFEGKKGDSKLVAKLGARCILVDFTKEKPWERKTRLLAWACRAAAKHKKTLSQALAEELYHRCHKDVSQMLQEVEKLCLYAKDASTITQEDMNALCGKEHECNTWAFAEAMVWEGKILLPGAFEEMDVSHLLSLVGQLRYHYQLALQMKEMLARGEKELHHHFPSIQPKTLQKYSQLALRLQESVLKKGLTTLFACEVKAKSTSVDAHFLWTDLVARLGR